MHVRWECEVRIYSADSKRREFVVQALNHNLSPVTSKSTFGSTSFSHICLKTYTHISPYLQCIKNLLTPQTSLCLLPSHPPSNPIHTSTPTNLTTTPGTASNTPQLLFPPSTATFSWQLHPHPPYRSHSPPKLSRSYKKHFRF